MKTYQDLILFVEEQNKLNKKVCFKLVDASVSDGGTITSCFNETKQVIVYVLDGKIKYQVENSTYTFAVPYWFEFLSDTNFRMDFVSLVGNKETYTYVYTFEILD